MLTEQQEKEMFWDMDRTLSYNALFNFIVGNRGGGKTYGFKKKGIDTFLKTGEQFIYLRRTEVDTEDSVPKYFDDIKHKYPSLDMKVRGRTFLINDTVCGFGCALSTSGNKKSISYPNVGKICFDEFIVDTTKANQRYLKGEVIMLLNFYETVARCRENVKMFFLSNSFTEVNPYFQYFNLRVPENKKKIICRNDKLVELVENEKFKAYKRDTRFGKLINGTEFSEHAIDNSFYLDNDTFIEKKTPESKHMFSFIDGGITYSVWCDKVRGILYVNTMNDPYCAFVYCLSQADHKPNTMLLKGSNKPYYLKFLLEQFKLGNVRYSNLVVKNVVADIICKMM